MTPKHATMVAAAALILVAAAPATPQARLQPDSADAHYRVGLSLLERGEARIPSPWGVLDGVTVWEDALRLFGRDNISRAERAFARAVELDSTHAGAATELARLALGAKDEERLEAAERALAAASASPYAPPEVWLWRSRVAAALGRPAASGEEFARRYAGAGGDRSLGRLAEARALLAAGRDSAGAAAYLDGVEALSAAASDVYFADLEPILREGERGAWGLLSPAERAEWLRRFWTRRAAEAGVPVEERVAEHYRRLAVAHERYRRTSRREASTTSVAAIEHGRDEYGLDDRGVIYLLHGEPDTIVRTVDDPARLAPNESWLYRRPDADRVLHFAALTRANEFVLLRDVTAVSRAGGEGLVDYLEDRRGLDARLGLLAERYRAAQQLRSERGTSRAESELALSAVQFSGDIEAASRAALARDTHEPDLGEPLRFFYDTYAFRGVAGQAEVVAAVAVPGYELEPRPAGGGVVYPLRLELALLDTAAATSFRADTVRVFSAPEPLHEAANLRAVVSLTVPPGRHYTHRVAVRTAPEVEPPAGGAYGGSVAIPDFRGDTLMISDLVLAEPDGTGWRRGAVELGLVPPRQFPRGGAVTLFYELYNLPAETPFSTRIRIERLEGGGVLGWLRERLGMDAAPFSVDFQDTAHRGPAGEVAIRRLLDVAGLDAGAYRLTVVTRAAGRTLIRSTELAIQERD